MSRGQSQSKCLISEIGLRLTVAKTGREFSAGSSSVSLILPLYVGFDLATIIHQQLWLSLLQLPGPSKALWNLLTSRKSSPQLTQMATASSPTPFLSLQLPPVFTRLAIRLRLTLSPPPVLLPSDSPQCQYCLPQTQDLPGSSNPQSLYRHRSESSRC